jgi:hypothetical protein
MAKKAALTKSIQTCVYKDGELWNVQFGELKKHQGNPGKTEHLFRVVGEKLPYEALAVVKKHVREQGFGTNGVYVAHDSMGFARYIGRGVIFDRLRARKDAQLLELTYFSFYVVSEKKHEREIETLLIRAAGPLLEFNTRKKRVSIMPGNIRDYEAGTYFYERQYKKGR